MATHSENPWVFERDEIDLLEEDLDEIYRTHADSQVLEELLEIQEQEDDFVIARPLDDTSTKSVKEILRVCSYRNPLYELVFVWSQKVSGLAFQFYNKDSLSEDAFVAYVVAKLIPIKPSPVYFSQILEVLQNLSETFGDDWIRLYEEGLKIKSMIEKERI